MNLRELQRHWDAFGEQDPMWAILTDPARKGRRWTAEAFFATGVAEVAALMADARAFGLPAARRRALDFGCGIGRLTQALADHCDEALGLDVAPSMIAQASAFNRHGARVRYQVQAAPPFDGVASRSIDVVYTGRVLQHIAPAYAREYIGELARVVAPGGFLSFDVPSRWLDEPVLPEGALAAGAYRAGLRATRRGQTHALVSVDLVVTNTGTAPWPAGTPLNVGNHWLSADGAMLVADDRRVAVPLPLAPGESATVTFETARPATPGAVLLELDVVHEGVAWCAWHGSPTLRLDMDGPGAGEPAAPAAVPAEASAVAAAPGAFEPVMEMHAVPRADVEALLAAAGVRLLRVRAETHCGPRWEAFRYDVTADTAG